MPRRPIAPRTTLAPHSFQNNIQGRPADLQSTPLKGTKLSLFLTARLYSYSCVEIQRSTSSGKPEIVHCQGRPRELLDTRLRLFGTTCQRTLVAQPHPLASNNCLRLNFLLLHSAANLFFLCIRVILTDESLHAKPIV